VHHCGDVHYYIVGAPAAYAIRPSNSKIQESLANAKVNARQQCVYEGSIANQFKQHNVEKCLLQLLISH